ncbi:MAG: XdhC family protein [Pseudomonadota bacterium]|nr:XdhC family protein [Pseudomonadota bacterium]
MQELTMQAMDKEVLGQIQRWLMQGESCWLATVVKTWGSSPRPEGSLFACNKRGQITGSLSGGCVEEDLLEKLTQGELAVDSPQFFQYGITAEETEKLGLPCGGHLYIVIEPLQPTDTLCAHFEQVNAALDERRCVQRTIDLRKGKTTIIDVEKHLPLTWDDANQVLTQTYGPRYQLFIIGAGMVSRYLAEMAGMLDYDVTVCDPREDLLADFDMQSVKKITDMPDDAVAKYAKDQATAIVALTHDPRIDDMGLMEALTTDAFYIGAMGSRRTSASRRERLRALDLTDADIDKLHAPIGLPIGSKTPPEIAIAILAEITAVRKQVAPAAQTQLSALSAG